MASKGDTAADVPENANGDVTHLSDPVDVIIDKLLGYVNFSNSHFE